MRKSKKAKATVQNAVGYRAVTRETELPTPSGSQTRTVRAAEVRDPEETTDPETDAVPRSRGELKTVADLPSHKRPATK